VRSLTYMFADALTGLLSASTALFAAVVVPAVSSPK
jgi:hypothetical protein